VPGTANESQKGSSMEKVNLTQKLALFTDHWHPRIVGELNDSHVKLVKVQGEFVWHHHEHEDELFLVLNGRLQMQFRDRDVWLEAGEFIIVPRGVEHRPMAPEEVHLLLLEPKSTLNTGNVMDEKTVTAEWI
jgi:mannose-6-phosphate isomerase-like protein (cupin superfamily)